MDISWFKSRRESGMSNSTVDSGYAGSVGNTNGFSHQDGSNGIVQMCGTMQKKPFGHQSTKWSRRFFVLKEGFLLYYAEGEKKTFETKRVFNIHPKGVIPLGNCTIEDLTLPGMPHCINIRNPELKTQVCVAADDEELRKIWIRAMDKATKVTMENTGLSEIMIKSLQEQSLRLARERQEYVDKFISEAEELGAERELREALEEFNEELEEENARIEGLVEELKAQYEGAKIELSNAIESSKRLEQEREEMRIRTDELQKNLAELSDERSAIIEKLQDRNEAITKMPGEENVELARQLAAIEKRAKLLEKDKEEIRLKLEENQMMSKDLLLEREAIAQEAEELKTEMQNLSQEKKLAEEELKGEIVARMQLQKELEECKSALKRLEAIALGNASVSTQENSRTVENPTKSPERDEMSDNEQIIRDVKSLREFFENCARDNTMDDKPPPSIRRKLQGGTINKRESAGSGPGSLDEDQNASPSRVFGRASIIRRRPQTARCKSMVLEDFSLSPMVRDPNHRRSVLLSRHQRSLSLSGKKKSSLSKKNES